MSIKKEKCCEECERFVCDNINPVKQETTCDCPCHQSESIEWEKEWEEYSKTVSADFIEPGYGANEEVKDFIRKAITTAVEAERETENGRQILVMSEFVNEKGRDYPLGKYLDMLIAIINPSKE